MTCGLFDFRLFPIILGDTLVIVTSRRLDYFEFDVADRYRASRLLSESGFL